MKRTLRLILTGLLLVLSTMLHSLVVKADASLNVSDFAGLQSALSDADSVINITIDASFEITALLTVPTGKTVTITSGTGGPYTLTREGSVTGNLITVAASSSLTLSNIILDGNKGALNANGSLILSNGDLTLNAGAVIQNNASGNAATIGGGITINATGSFTMHGGRITNNSSNSYGGGLYINGFSTPYLIDGGEFSYNHADAPGLGCGGAIESYGIGTITNTLFIGNSVAYMGGAIDNMAI